GVPETDRLFSFRMEGGGSSPVILLRVRTEKRVARN
ncbi:MAG: hypothetical protein RLZZ142_227, partial [Verrucomicrobiota bacterium]